MLSPILSRSKWRLTAHGRSIVVVHNPAEKITHPLMKAYLWALYLPQYPTSTIEVRIGDRYKPDVVALDMNNPRLRENEPIFWGEAGQTARDKIRALVRRYPTTHFALAKWDMRLKPYADQVEEALRGVRRAAPFDLIQFPAGCEQFVDDTGAITIEFEHVERIRFDNHSRPIRQSVL